MSPTASQAIPSRSADCLNRLEAVVAATIDPSASETDKLGRFPRENLRALAQAGLLGLISDSAVGGAPKREPLREPLVVLPLKPQTT